MACNASNRSFSRAALMVACLVVALAHSLTITPVHAVTIRIAVLHIEFQNDHAEYEPTRPDETERLRTTKLQFAEMLDASEKYEIVPVEANLAETIAKGQKPGSCGGCEFDYGKKLDADQVAWLEVQKVSNLILNLNIYIADVKEKKIVFVKSADIRGNTDRSWNKALRFMVRNYVLSN